MATADLTNETTEIITGKDNVVIVNHFDGIRGGRTLDVTGFAPKVIHAGHVIIKTSAGEYAPMPLTPSGDAYATLPEDAEYAGYLVATISKENPFAGIMVRGTINPKATPFDMASIIEAVKTALPLIDYQED